MAQDIQATRSAAAAGATAIVAQPIRLRAISIASDGVAAGVLELTTTSNAGATLLFADIPTGDVLTLNFLLTEFYFQKEFFVKLKLM